MNTATATYTGRKTALRRPPSQRDVRLTERDLCLLAWVLAYGVVNAEQAGRILGTPSVDATYRVLQRLTRDDVGLLRRQRVSDRATDCSVWVITPKGRREALASKWATIPVSAYRATSGAQVAHRLRILDVALEYTANPMFAGWNILCDRLIESVDAPRGRFRSRARAQYCVPIGYNQVHIPDLVLTHPTGRRIFVEVELTPKRMDSAKGTLRPGQPGYRQLLDAFYREGDGVGGRGVVHYWVPGRHGVICGRLRQAATLAGLPEGSLYLAPLREASR